MKRILFSVALGAIAGYAIHRCQEKKFFEKLYQNVNLFRLKRKNASACLEEGKECIGNYVNGEVLK